MEGTDSRSQQDPANISPKYLLLMTWNSQPQLLSVVSEIHPQKLILQ